MVVLVDGVIETLGLYLVVKTHVTLWFQVYLETDLRFQQNGEQLVELTGMNPERHTTFITSIDNSWGVANCHSPFVFLCFLKFGT